MADRTRALRAFGDVAHALADFYSHTNWVELYANTGKLPPLAPLLDTVCDFDRDSLKIPGEVQSGYFSVPEVVPIVGPITSCPDKPPAGYSYCHEQLNKDHARKGKGGKSIPNIGRTYHEVARELAIETTRKAWENVRERILARYGETKTIDAECIFAKLAWGGGRTCHRLWRIRGSVAENTHVTGVKEFAQRADITGLDFQFSWDPVRYPGPQGPDVQVLVKSRPSGGRVHWRTTAGSLPGPTITCDANGMNSSTEGGRALYKLSPEDEPLDLYDLIRFAASAIPKCEAIHPDLGRMPVPQMPPMRISVPLPEKAALGRCQGSGFSLKLRPGKYDFGPCFYATKATGQHLNFIRSMQLVLELVEK